MLNSYRNTILIQKTRPIIQPILIAHQTVTVGLLKTSFMGFVNFMKKGTDTHIPLTQPPTEYTSCLKNILYLSSTLYTFETKLYTYTQIFVFA